ncbi:MAG: phosphatidylserine decarboxylase [Bacteriovoracaceae bacterium]|nr:phosphatidylserine decarboxylase [Bacteriovoracaceae bacterium]
MEIKYYNRKANCLETEKVYGDKFLKWLYQTGGGRALTTILCKAPISKFYGALQNLSNSRNKIADFIVNFDIKMEEYLPECDGKEGYSSFNNFFIRKFKEGVRHFIATPNVMPAFCEARYLGLSEVTDETTFPVKGKDYQAKKFLNNTKWESTFTGGPLIVARLCPTDYHRFHFIDNGKVLDHYKVKGPLHSVSPVAIKEYGDILASNKREVTIIETENFGKIAYIEVGAICVGAIVQNYEGNSIKRGQEKGYFLFGGSTVVILGEKGAWKPSGDILSNSEQGIETYIQLGDEVASREA